MNQVMELEIDDSIDRAMNVAYEQFSEGSTVWIILFSLLAVISIFYFIRGVWINKKRAIESVNFLIFCIPVIVWAFFIAGGSLFGFDIGNDSFLGVVIQGAYYFIPALLMLHIWSQVSYKLITTSVWIIWLAVPAILTAATAVKAANPGLSFDTIAIGAGEFSVISFASLIFFVIVVAKSYLLCFNVFYQMPQHMRQSTYQMLIAITAITIARGITMYFDFPQDLSNLLFCAALIVAMYTLYTAFFIATAANVIVTSRDFVFASLSTLVIMTSMKGNILDWNRKSKDGCLPLPNPRYKEPYAHYRKRILETCNGTVSPHDENILNIQGTDGENNFLFTWHDIGYQGRQYGYLIEIADVTNIYTKLRYIEVIAYYDNLTSLHNRNAYIERVRQIAKPESMPLLIIIGDVNNLKMVNDLYGHLSGDNLLLTVTKAVKDCAPESAFVARIGGDELVVLVPKANDQMAASFIEDVTNELNTVHAEGFGTPSVSWGYAVMRDITENYNDVFRTADGIMYEAKRKSREVTISGMVPNGGGHS